jgi:hypothetical protein
MNQSIGYDRTHVAPAELEVQFAECLDRRNYTALNEPLSAECVYEMRGRVIRGPSAIVDAYREATEWAFNSLQAAVEVLDSVGKDGARELVVIRHGRMIWRAGINN